MSLLAWDGARRLAMHSWGGKSKLGGEAEQNMLKSTRKHGYIQTGLTSMWAGKNGHYHVLRLASSRNMIGV